MPAWQTGVRYGLLIRNPVVGVRLPRDNPRLSSEAGAANFYLISSPSTAMGHFIFISSTAMVLSLFTVPTTSTLVGLRFTVFSLQSVWIFIRPETLSLLPRSNGMHLPSSVISPYKAVEVVPGCEVELLANCFFKFFVVLVSRLVFLLLF